MISGNSFTKKARDDSNRGQDSHARHESFRSLRREVRAIHPCRLRNHGQIGARLKSVTLVESRECRFFLRTPLVHHRHYRVIGKKQCCVTRRESDEKEPN